MRQAIDVWTRFDAAQGDLDAALATLDAAAILQAAADVHAAAADLAQSGLGHEDDAVTHALNQALKRIESCRLRVMFLADHSARHVAGLTPGTASAGRWRPDRAA